jgi:hypothetical protein
MFEYGAKFREELRLQPTFAKKRKAQCAPLQINFRLHTHGGEDSGRRYAGNAVAKEFRDGHE